jgi:c(7)-type cytochrome triheme protein
MKPYLRIAVLCLSASVGVAMAAEIARHWPTLAQDVVHDPKGPAVQILQQPRDALSALPADAAGNLVNWVEALEKGHINPRTNVFPETNVRVRETDVLLNLTGSTPIVKFPHRAHTLWLDCTNCHDHLFKPEAGANKLSMERILSGEQCGVCHGAVAFPLTECARCHSVPREPPVGRSR